jgi:anti-sigma-K factor RskA
MTYDPHSLTGAYALDALDADERRVFEEHLATCEACAEEVSGLVSTASRLGAAAGVQPPESLRAGVMAKVRATRQLPPSPPARGAGGPPQDVHRPRSRVLMAVAAALLVVAGGLGVVAFSEQRRAARAEQAAGQLAAVLGAPDARTLTAVGSAGSSARVVFSGQQRRAVFVAHAMTAAEGRDLQLWVIAHGTFRSAGLVEGGRPILAEGVDVTSVLGVTVEPDGGSRQPTSTPVLKVPLT